MASSQLKIPIGEIGSRQLKKLKDQARAAGITPELYAVRLIDEGISLEDISHTRTVDQLLAPLRAEFKASGTTFSDFDDLVDQARTRHFNRRIRKKQ